NAKNVLLTWINSRLEVNVQTIKEMKTGALYCNLFGMFYPGDIRTRDVEFNCVTEEDSKKNWEILQEAFQNVMIHRDIPINELIQGHENEHLQFLKWAYKYFSNKEAICTAVQIRSNSKGGKNFHRSSENNSIESIGPQDNFTEVPESNISQKDAKINEDDDAKNDSTDIVERLKNSLNTADQRYNKAKKELTRLHKERKLFLSKFAEITVICREYQDQKSDLVTKINKVAYYIFAFVFNFCVEGHLCQYKMKSEKKSAYAILIFLTKMRLQLKLNNLS
ncbi:hypothetical protein RFI_24083, partial [Reticulomyxa filosa]